MQLLIYIQVLLLFGVVARETSNPNLPSNPCKVVNNMIQLSQCAAAIRSGAVKVVSGSSPSKVHLGSTNETIGNQILLAEELDLDGVSIKNYNNNNALFWTKIHIKAKKIRNPKHFELVIEDQPLLKTIVFDHPKVFASSIIKVLNCPQLESMPHSTNKFSIIPRLQTCKFTNVTEMMKLNEKECRWWSGEVIFRGNNTLKLPTGRIQLDERACLLISGTHLVSISQIRFPDKQQQLPTYKKLSCNSSYKIEDNNDLCLSQVVLDDLKTHYGWEDLTKDNEKHCDKHKCDAGDFVMGKTGKKACQILEGDVVLDADSAGNKANFSKILEIRGKLIIANTSAVDYWKTFSSLMYIEGDSNKTQNQSALEFVNTTISNFEIGTFSRANGYILFEKNSHFDETAFGLWNRTFPGRILWQEQPYPPDLEAASTTEHPTAITAEYPHSIAQPLLNRTQSEKGQQWWIFGSIGLGGLILIVLICLVVCLIRRKQKKRFFLPSIAILSLPKRKLLCELAEEIFEMNPLEWRMSIQQEVTAPKTSLEKESVLKTVRMKQTKFLDMVQNHIAFDVRPPPDTIAYDLFKQLRKYYENTKAQGPLILLSRAKDPELSIPIFAMQVGQSRGLAGGISITTTVSLTQEKSTTEMGKPIFELTSILKSKKEYNPNIDLYTYNIYMKEMMNGIPNWSAIFTLELVHYHNWSEANEDYTTLLRLIEYGRLKKYHNQPVFVASTISQAFATMMLSAVVYHMVDKSMPEISLKELKSLIAELTNCPYPDPVWFIYSLMMTVKWAEREDCILSGRRQAHADFVHIYERMTEYLKNNPNSYLLNARDLNLDTDVLKRVEASPILEGLIKAEAAVPLAAQTTIEPALGASIRGRRATREELPASDSTSRSKETRQESSFDRKSSDSLHYR